MRHLDLFSGIGGFALAARNVGWDTIQFVEIDPYCQKVLAKNFPGVPIHADVETFRGRPGGAEIISAGWPCQDISNMGTRLGLDGERSGLWKDVARIVGEVRPRIVVLENVTALLNRWLGIILGELAAIGYDCEWHCIPASAVGAPHRRDRVWIIAYANGIALRNESGRRNEKRGSSPKSRNDGAPQSMADADRRRCEIVGQSQYGELESETGNQSNGRRSERRGNGAIGRDPGCKLLEGWQPQGPTNRSDLWNHAEWWAIEPGIRRVANGVPCRVDRLRALGNAIVPQVAQSLFEAINKNL